MSGIDRAVKEAHRAVREAASDDRMLAQFKVVRFGRHRDGYLHAQVTLGDLPIYVSRRSGSWQIPREPQAPNCPVVFEDQCVLQDVLAPYNFALAAEARRFQAAERKRQEGLNAERKRTEADRRETEEADGGTEAAEAA